MYAYIYTYIHIDIYRYIYIHAPAAALHLLERERESLKEHAKSGIRADILLQARNPTPSILNCQIPFSWS